MLQVAIFYVQKDGKNALYVYVYLCIYILRAIGMELKLKQTVEVN